ncbi:MAG: hypothetical protein CL912_16560 [Deltaproteobacteria bacterium]|nr:hypothetical protein [Deltaproteobacteria bacterium]
MGGYILGGGHSPLSSIHGMGADHIASLSVVLPSGRYITATPTQNHDIYWALCGGGGSTVGVVTSVTVKAYPDIPVTVFQFSFSAKTSTVFWAGVRTFFNYFIPLSNAGTYSYFWVFPGAVPTFSMNSFFAPNWTISETQALLKPWFEDLASLGITSLPKLSITQTTSQHGKLVSRREVSAATQDRLDHDSFLVPIG